MHGRSGVQWLKFWIVDGDWEWGCRRGAQRGTCPVHLSEVRRDHRTRVWRCARGHAQIRGFNDPRARRAPLPPPFPLFPNTNSNTNIPYRILRWWGWIPTSVFHARSPFRFRFFLFCSSFRVPLSVFLLCGASSPLPFFSHQHLLFAPHHSFQYGRTNNRASGTAGTWISKSIARMHGTHGSGDDSLFASAHAMHPLQPLTLNSSATGQLGRIAYVFTLLWRITQQGGREVASRHLRCGVVIKVCTTPPTGSHLCLARIENTRYRFPRQQRVHTDAPTDTVPRSRTHRTVPRRKH
ncbi:hypothetical protein BDW22DRAFT_902430 [Trametopsis cervina]|nr:hypothetical protein BDW22DRAFT_902430 [Trametopsis cervina]